jgi:tetratricopeptide (TPR) repeat protein
LKSAKSTQEKARIHHNLGNAQFEKGDYKRAIDSYKSSLRLNPSDQKTRYNLSEALKREHARQNKPQKKKDQNNQKKQNSPKKSPSDKSKKPSNQANQKNSTNPQDPENSNGSLPKKDVERKLDELSRKEGETRRKMSKGNRTKGTTNSSKKDW